MGSSTLPAVIPDKINTVPAALPMPTAPTINDVAKVMHASGFFKDIKSVAQAAVKIMAGQELGVPPVAAIMGIHIIKEKVSMGANLLASRIRAHGYDYRIKRIDNKGCSILFLSRIEHGKREELGLSEFLEEDAKAAGLTGSDNWRKYAKNMYFARAISNGVKWYTPDVTAGTPIYTPDELGVAVNAEGDAINVQMPEVRTEEPATNGTSAVVDPEPPAESAIFTEDDCQGKPKAVIEIMMAANAIRELAPEEAEGIPEKYFADGKLVYPWEEILKVKNEKWMVWFQKKVLPKMHARIDELSKAKPAVDIQEDPIPGVEPKAGELFNGK